MPKYQPLNWYDAPLYYDIIFDEGTRDETNFLEDSLAAHGRTDGWHVLEPACGSGRLVAALASRGYTVAGCDISEHMLRYARGRIKRRKLRATLLNEPMQTFAQPDTFDLAHCLVSTFKYLLTEDDAVSHLRCVARSLKPGGIYVLGLHFTDYDDDRTNRERWVARRRGVHVVCNIQGWPADQRNRLERVRSRLIVTRSGEMHHYETNWQFRTYNLQQLRDLLAKVPALEHIATYGFDHRIDNPVPFDGRQLDVVLILRRRS